MTSSLNALPDDHQLLTLNRVELAAQRLTGVVVRTPLLPIDFAGHQFHIKPENLQRIGSFKLRGAFNAISALPEEVRERGVVAFSSGNHAQGVAYVARMFDIPAWIVIEDSAPAVKVQATRALGANVVIARMENREEVAEALAAEHHTVVIPSFSNLDVMAGQGTIGLEILADCPDVTTVLVPVSGGGLASGVAAAIKLKAPHVRVLIVEPELAADTAASLNRGQLVRWSADDRRRTIADGLAGQPTPLSFAHIQRFTDGSLVVSDDQIRAAIAFLGRSARLVAEPAGAVTTAACLSNPDLLAGQTVAILSGGNIDPRLFREILEPSIG